jgi:excisionase family DNA binding protein
MGKTLSVRDLCERYGVSEHTVLAWINSGEMQAINVSRRGGAKKPRWRISEGAIEAFEVARTAAPTQPRKRRKARPPDVIKFY